ncbi:oxidase/Diels-Alderase [Hypoxylon trugodes]|uniref:oxidase/Diels-Alderase n=1 Tax=Hypoxylon trugodes TaxID=326681 RepID=UPI0021914A17|nr:oxidase/Diels-Alderase [Hypoxylon trugodes]KAI1389021.1 oxidase/Diels-Alderase [Hypoxylon trugodes]
MDLFWLLLLVYAAYVGGSSGADPVDQFLSSLGLDPDNVSPEAKSQGGTELVCAALASVGNYSATTTTQANGTVYIQQADAHWSATAYKQPLCIFSPVDIDELRTAILLSNFSGSQFAIRSGGHSPLPNWANINGGLLLSMTHISDLSYNETSETQRSGMGNTWGDIYNYLVPYGRVVDGGRLGEVGLGLATGGGLSHMSNANGWVSQNVVSYEIMLSNGTHLTASHDENSDLYYAAKAGSNNFGVVTHITQRTFQMGKVWGGIMQFPGNYSTQFMEAMFEYQTDGQLDTKSAVLPYIGINNDTIITTFVYFDEVQRPEAFKPFYDIPTTVDQTMVWDNFYELSKVAVDFAVPRWTWGATTLGLDKDTYAGLIAVFSEFVPRIQNITGGTLAPMIQPISKTMVENSRVLGDDPMNVDPDPQIWVSIDIGWSLAADDATVDGILRDCLAAVEDYTRSRGVYKPFLFLNDAHASQNPLQSYGQDSFDRLKVASLAYDPTQMFQTLVPGGFKLS